MKYLVAFLTTCLLGYLAGSFAMWNWNPGAWAFDMRMLFLSAVALLVFPAMGIASEFRRKG